MLQTLNIPSSPLPDVASPQSGAPGDAGERAEFAQLLRQAKASDGACDEVAMPLARSGGRDDLRARHGIARPTHEARNHDVRRARTADPAEGDCEPTDLASRLATHEPITDAAEPAVDTESAAQAPQDDDPAAVVPDAAALALTRHTEPLPATDRRLPVDTAAPADDERSAAARPGARSVARGARLPMRPDAEAAAPDAGGARAAPAAQTALPQTKDATPFDGLLRAGGRATGGPSFERAPLDGAHVSAQATAFARELQQAIPTHRGVAAEAALQTAPDDAGFAPALGAQLALWVKDGVQEARLHLHPTELGPVSVQIALEGRAAHVDFTAAVAATRDSIEQSLPTLAAALRESGFTLAGGGVFGGRPGSGDGSRERASEGRGTRGTAAIGSADGIGEAGPVTPRRWTRSLVDVYA